MRRNGEKKWDDFLRNGSTTCTTDLMPGFQLNLPVLSGCITMNGITVDEGTNQSDDNSSRVVVSPISTLSCEGNSLSHVCKTDNKPLWVNRKSVQKSKPNRLYPMNTQTRSILMSEMFERPPRESSLDHRSSSNMKDVTQDSDRDFTTGQIHSKSAGFISRPHKPAQVLWCKDEMQRVTSLSSQNLHRLTPATLSSSSTRSSYKSTGSNLSRKWRKLRRSEMKNAIVKEREVMKLKPIEKLKRILKSIRIIVEVCLALKSYVKNKEEKEQLTLVEMQLNLQDDLNKKLTFNPHYFSASYVANKGSSKLKKLLAISPAARSKRHVKTIHTLIQNKNAFSKHPVHIRLKMCQVMIYQSYESRRVIIKQGHPPSAFYIILSGTCLINAKETDKSGSETNQTVNELKEGDVFGEVALLNKTMRTASVVCKDDVELLVIYKEDFDAIIRGPIYKQREEVIEYCKNLHILKDWPVKQLSNASLANFQHQYYRKGAVVVKNNIHSNFLVFVKSGECRVVCTLDGFERRDEFHDSHFQTRHKSIDIKTTLPLLDQTSRARVLQPRSMSLAINSTRQPARPAIRLAAMPDKDARKTIDENSGLGSSRDYLMARKRRFEPGMADHWKNETEFRREVHERKRLIMVQTLGMLTNPTRSMRSSNSLLDSIGEHATIKQTRNRLDVPLSHNIDSQKPGEWKRPIRASIVEDTPYAVAKKGKNLIVLNRWKKATTAISAALPKIQPKPKFAQIALLGPGCVFGLEEMMKRTELRLSLLSEGAECIFISKKMFLRHAGVRTLRCVNGMVGRYPTEEFIRNQLAEQSEWTTFRREVVKDVLERREEKIEIFPYLKPVY